MKNYLQKRQRFSLRKILLLLMVALLGSGMAFSQIVVTSDADNGAGSLRQALVDAVDGDVIVFNGVTSILVGNPLEMGDKTISIDGGGAVVLDGALTGTVADSFRVVTITGVAGKVVTLANLTIQNGYAKDTTGSFMNDGGADGGGAIFAYNAAGGQTVLQNCIFQNNKSFGRGGAVKSFGASLISDCQFLNNTAEDAAEGDGGGLYAHYATISGCTFDGNTAADRAGGAGVDTLCILSNCTFTGNSSGDHGGGLYSLDTTVLISACIFDGNTSVGRGGGMFLNYGSASGCEITNNTSNDHGGGVWLNRAILINSLISGNTTDPDEDGGGVGMTYTSVLANCTITGNHASDQGGGIFTRSGLIQNCIITGNTAADDGGGLFMDDYEVTRTGTYTSLVGCVVTNNSAIDNSGGIYLEAGAVVNSIIANNNCDDDAGGIEGRKGPWFIVNSVVYGNAAGDSDANIRFTENTEILSAAYSAFEATGVDAFPSANMFTLNESPFIGGSGADSLMFHDGSLLLDAGITDFGVDAVLPSLDLAGNPRLDGPVDIGPYEKVGGFVKVDVTGVTLDQSTLTLDIGATGTLVATIAPERPSIDTVTWSSDNEAVATVADGVVTGVAEGSATITVTTTDGSLTATCAVTVNPAAIETASITFIVDDTKLATATGFAIKGSWLTATGEYDAAWGGGAEHSDFFDDGSNGDATAGDHIWTVTLELVPDAGANTWEWGVNDSEENWLDGNFQFTVTDATAQTLDAYVILNNDASLSALSLDVGTLDPSFDAGTLSYTAEVPQGTTSVTVSATATDAAAATISGDGAIDVSSGSATASVVVTAEDGSTTSYTIEITVLVGIEQSMMDMIEVYPNPVSGGKVYIKIGDPGIESFEIFNILGATILKENVDGRKLIELETPVFKESGMYFVKMIKGQSIIVEQFIVQ